VLHHIRNAESQGPTVDGQLHATTRPTVGSQTLTLTLILALTPNPNPNRIKPEIQMSDV